MDFNLNKELQFHESDKQYSIKNNKNKISKRLKTGTDSDSNEPISEDLYIRKQTTLIKQDIIILK